MLRPFRSPWLVAGVLMLAVATAAEAQPQSPSATTGAPSASGAGVMTTLGGLGNLLGSLISPEQDAQLLATALSEVQMLGRLIPLSTGEELFLVFLLYEFEKLNAIQGMLFGGGTTPPTSR